MNLSYVQKVLIAADPFSAARTDFRGWKRKIKATGGTPELRKLLRGRHLTVGQREDISTELQDSMEGPVSITAAASDREAICYQGEIANVVEKWKMKFASGLRGPGQADSSQATMSHEKSTFYLR
jgi:hypothetical protein